MNFPAGLFAPGWAIAAWLPLLAALVWAARSAPWARLAAPARLHVWSGLAVGLALLWSLKAGIKPGLDLHLLGATLYVLACGPQLALLGLTGVLAAVTANGDAGWSAFALNALTGVLVPVGAAQFALRFAERHLPPNFFVYVFVAAFLGAAFAAASATGAAVLLLWAAGVYPLETLLGEYLPYGLMLAFSEAWICGALLTLMVVYRPGWVSSFDDARYLTH